MDDGEELVLREGELEVGRCRRSSGSSLARARALAWATRVEATCRAAGGSGTGAARTVGRGRATLAWLC